MYPHSYKLRHRAQLRRALLALCVVLLGAQTLAEQHLHPDFDTDASCMLCLHGDHSADSSSPEPAPVESAAEDLAGCFAPVAQACVAIARYRSRAPPTIS